MPPKRKFRADQLVFEQGLAESREKAKSLIMAGRIALKESEIGGNPRIVLKPGQQLISDTQFLLLPGKDFVSRGAYKLVTILDGFKLDVHGMVCLDAGASTGGFTDCLLQRGATKVYAVDVGKNQLHEKLRNDARVVSMEGVNIRFAPPDLLPEKVDFFCGDLSFISLTKIIPACLPWLKPGALCALLIKPQFELGPDKTDRGVVRSEEDRQLAVLKIQEFCERQMGMSLQGVLPAQIRGPKGNQEYMALFNAPY